MSWPPFLRTEDAELAFDETLTSLLGLVGRRVEVRLADSDGLPVAVAHFEGVLERATDISILERADAEAQFFHVVAGETTAGFLIHAGTFGGGQAVEQTAVRFLAGHVLVTVTIVAD